MEEACNALMRLAQKLQKLTVNATSGRLTRAISERYRVHSKALHKSILYFTLRHRIAQFLFTLFIYS